MNPRLLALLILPGLLLAACGPAVYGLHVVESHDCNDRSGRLLAVVDEYRERFQLEPGDSAAAAHDAATVMLDVLTRRDAGQSLKEALIARGSFAGLQQAIRFDRYGDTTRNGYFVTMRAGRFVLRG